jgi:hypothetical protein
MLIENDGLRGYTSVDLIGQGKYSLPYYNLTENVSEQNLKNILNVITGNGYVSLGYNVARDSMFMVFDNKKINGQGAAQNTIECVYTGREAVGYIDRTDCQQTFFFNTEHTFPQSFFSSTEPMKSDLHHLFPTDDQANNQRGDNPFGIVTSPSWSVGGSLSDGVTFEPRDIQKGSSARALFYFVLRYQNYTSFLNSQESILKNWHFNFLPSTAEILRNDAIYSLQQNRNPFIDYPVFIERITSLSSNSVAPLVSSIDLPIDTIVYGTVAAGTPVVYYYSIVNNGNVNINFSNFMLTHPAQMSFASSSNDTTIAPGESLTLLISCIASTTDSIRAFLTFNTNATGHTSVSVPIFINDHVFTAVNEINSELNIFPNPVFDFQHISLSKNSNISKVNIFDLSGKLIYNTFFEGCETVLDLGQLPSGLFLLQLQSDNGIINKKFVVH